MPPTTGSRLLMEPVEGVAVVHFVDDALMSERVIQQVEEQLNELVEQLGPGKVLINFRDVHHMSSAVLGVLLKLSRKVAETGGQLRLCGLEPSLREAFRASQLERSFAIYDQEAAALDTF